MASKNNVGSVFFDIQTNNGAFTKGIRSAASSAQSVMSSAMGNVGKYIATAFSATAVISFGKKCVEIAKETQSAWQGLSSILNGQGKNFAAADEFIQSYISDGLVPLNNAVSAYKNLAARGYSTEQIEKVMLALKDSAAFGRQASYAYGEAIQTATEGLKNENSILVDNAGVTKNVAKMWEEYADSIGTTRDKLTDQQKIQAEVNGIIEETKWQAGDAAKYAGSFAGRIAQLSASYTTLKTSIGEAVMPLVNVFLPAVQSAINGATRLSNSLKSVMNSLGIETPDLSAYNTTASSASQAAQAIKEESNAVDTASKKAKKAKGAFAAFDEINVLSKGSDTSSYDSASDSNLASSSSSGSSGPANEVLKASKESEGVLSGVFDPLVNAWNNKGSGVISAAKNAFSQLKTLISSVKTSFKTVFENGTGQTSLELILTTATNILNTVGGIASAFNNAWTKAGNGTSIVQSTANSVNNLLSIANGVGASIASWWKSSAGQSFANTTVTMLKKISGNVERVTGKIKELWDNGGKAVFDNLLTAFGNIGEIIEIVIGYVSDFYADLVDWFAPDAEMGLNAVNDSLTSFNDLLDWLKTDGKPILEGVAYAIGIVTAGLIAYKAATTAVKLATTAYSAAQAVANAVMNANPITLIIAGITALIAVIILCVKHWDEIKAAMLSVWTVIKEKFSGVAKFFSEKFNAARDAVKTAFANIGTYFAEKWSKIKEKFSNVKTFFSNKFVGAYNAVKTAFANIGTYFAGKWKLIKEKFSNVKSFFSDKFQKAWSAIKKPFENVGSFFGGIWDTVKSKFTDIGTKVGDAVGGSFKKAINAVLATVESVLNAPIKAINSLIEKINSVPGIEISKLNTFDLPRLYNGAWLKANNPTLAVVGDNRHEGEIVTPESKIREQVEAALSKFKGCVTQSVQTVKLCIEVLVKYPDGKTVIRQINEAQIKEGRILIEL